MVRRDDDGSPARAVVAAAGIAAVVATGCGGDPAPAAPAIRAAPAAPAIRAALVGGGELSLLAKPGEIEVTVTGPGTGFPSLCIGDDARVEILHASAALGSIAYERDGDGWRRDRAFEWELRDRGPDAAPTDEARRAFFARYGWLSTANRGHAPQRAFRIATAPGRRLLGVTFVELATNAVAYWPPTMSDDCKALALVIGDAPERLTLRPAEWHALP